MTGSSGRRRRRAGSRTAGRAEVRRPRGTSRSPAFDGGHTAVEIGPKRGEVGCGGGWQRPEHDEIRAQPGQLRPDRRTQPTLDEVPDDGVTDGSAHDDAHPGRRVLPHCRRVHDEGRTRRTASAHCGSELVRAAHSVDLGKHTTPVVRRRDECGPCGAARRGSPCLRACASAAGTRASCCDGGCSVETYAYSRGLAPIFTVDRHGGRMVLGCCDAMLGGGRVSRPEPWFATMHAHTTSADAEPTSQRYAAGPQGSNRHAQACTQVGPPARSDTPRGRAEERSFLRLACGERLVLHPKLLLASGAGHEVLSRRLQRHLGHAPSQLCTACGQPCGCGFTSGRRPEGE